MNISSYYIITVRPILNNSNQYSSHVWARYDGKKWNNPKWKIANSRQSLFSVLFFSPRARCLYVWVWPSANIRRYFPNLLTHAFRVERSENISHFDSPSRFGCVDSIVLRSRRRCEAQWPERCPREFISFVPRKVLRCSIRYDVPLKKRDWNKIANCSNLQTEQEQQ